MYQNYRYERTAPAGVEQIIVIGKKRLFTTLKELIDKSNAAPIRFFPFNILAAEQNLIPIGSAGIKWPT